ncbi:benzoate 4-monooxygenase cytochrome p450 [Xylariales sp. PMI_506]|nr:benzoate 4-monooxygenase cytochrome p450 [Xylariales sp. PMI_506]
MWDTRWYLNAGAIVLLLVLCIRSLRASRAWISHSSTIPKAGLGATVSRLAWAFPREFRGTITLDLPKLHRRLGPLIYIGPNEVSFYSLDVYDLVHKVGSKFKKDPRVYGEFVQDGNPALFSITDPAEHSKRRRLMGQLFNRSKMHLLEGLMLDHAERFAAAVGQLSADGLDLVPACRALEADIISDFSFGTSIGAVEQFTRGEELNMVAKNDEKATWMPMLTTFPSLCILWDQIGDLLFNLTGFCTAHSRGIRDFDEWTDKSWHTALAENESVADKKSTFPNLIKTLVHSGLPATTALAEAKENLGPGTDTTSASLAHILWALAHNEQFQDDLYRDLSSVAFSTDMTTLEGVARLQATVKEGIRWTGAAAAMLPRLVPEGGIELYGHFIPAGTVMTSSPIWYLQDQTAFPRPEEYDPYRWLNADGKTIKEDVLRDKYYIPFSKGANVCMGAHFSYLELYISVSRILQQYCIRVHPSVPPQTYQATSQSPGGDFQCVPLPPRKEWVAAVPTAQLLVTMVPRK